MLEQLKNWIDGIQPHAEELHLALDTVVDDPTAVPVHLAFQIFGTSNVGTQQNATGLSLRTKLTRLDNPCEKVSPVRKYIMKKLGCICCLLVLLGCTTQSEKNTQLLKNAIAGNTVQVKKLLNSGALIGSRNYYGDTALHLAVKNNHLDTATLLVQRGADVNAKGGHDNTPLHLSTYENAQAIGDMLRDHGADESVLNRYGLRASEMADVPKVQLTVRAAAGLLSQSGSWLDRVKGQELYNKLKALEGDVVVNAIVLDIIDDSNLRLQTLILAIKLGIPKSEEKLRYVLMTYGTKYMAEDFLNSGSYELSAAGSAWANSHGYNVTTGLGSHRASWGHF